MSNYKEYNAPMVGQAGCTYSSLRDTYDGMTPSHEMQGMANYTVPKLCPDSVDGPSYPPRYDTLSHGQQYACGGYFSVKGAYPFADCTSCKADYVQRPCTGDISGACKPGSQQPSCRADYTSRSYDVESRSASCTVPSSSAKLEKYNSGRRFY